MNIPTREGHADERTFREYVDAPGGGRRGS